MQLFTLGKLDDPNGINACTQYITSLFLPILTANVQVDLDRPNVSILDFSEAG